MRRCLLPLFLMLSVVFMNGCVENFMPKAWYQWIAVILLPVVIIAYVIYRKKQQ